MASGDRAAEQYEKDQPSTVSTGHKPDAIYVPVCAVCGRDLTWNEDLNRWDGHDDDDAG
jgi:hypothetical protein